MYALREISSVKATKVSRGKKPDQQRAGRTCRHIRSGPKVKNSHSKQEHIPDDHIQCAQQIFTVDDESPSPGGFANGV